MQTTIKNQQISATINHKGAELSSLIKDEKNYIWKIDEKFWNKTSPILFPIVGGLKQDSYEFKGEKYQLPRHGFARDFDFEILEKSEDFVTFSLKFSDETLKIYPFKFELQISYILEDNKLIVRYKIINHDSEKMYFSIGAHPAFSIDGNFEDFSLVFDKNENLTTHKLYNNLFSGITKEIPLKNRVLPLNYDLFKEDAIVLKNSATLSLVLEKNSEKILKVNFPDFPYLGIWTKVGAPFICVEPWLGIADNHDASGKIEEKEGIQILEENSEKIVEWSVEIF